MKENMNKLLLILIVTAFFFTPICAGRFTHLFSQAEASMRDNPEQSLAILQSISISNFKSEIQRARYALLMSQALDKNYIDVDSDSLIKVAVDYYEKTSDHKNRMLAFYYEGRVLFNALDYTASAVYFEKAIKEATAQSDWLYLGLSNRALAEIMNQTLNIAQAIQYEKKAIESFRAGGETLYELYGWLSLAIAYSNDKQYDKAITIADSLLHLTDARVLQDGFEQVKAEALIESGKCDYTIPVDIYKRTNKDYFHPNDFGYYAYALDKLGLRDSADVYLEKAFTTSANHLDSAGVKIFQSRIEHNREHFQKAFLFLNEAVVVQDSLTRALLQQSVSVAQKDYYNKEAQYQELLAHNARLNTLLIGLVSTLIIIIGLFLVILQKRKSDALLKEQIAQLAMERTSNNRLLSQNALILGSLFSERLGHIDRLADDYMSAETPEAKEAIFKEYKKRCESLIKDEQIFYSLESDLNRFCEGIMDKLKVEVPTIKKNNLKIISLFFAGVPNISIQIIAGKPSRKAVDMERARYRKIINDSGAKHTALFLEMLDTKRRQPGE